MADSDKNWDHYLRTLSTSARDSSPPASDPSLLQSVKKICELCKAENSDDLVARVYPSINRLFHRSISSIPQSTSSHAFLLLAILQFFLDFGESVLHDADPSLTMFFRACLSRDFADPSIAEATIEFLNRNKKKLQTSFPTVLPQFFPLLLKLIAWNGEKLEKSFVKIFPALVAPGSFLPLYPAILDLPVLVIALEKVEKSSGSLVGSSIASIKSSTAPEMLLALMDEAYTGSTIAVGEGDSESEDNSTIDVADPAFLDVLKDENDGIAERHWTSPAIASAIEAATSAPQSDRLKQSLKIAPHLLDVYFAIALRDVNDSLICALIPLLMLRNAVIFPDKIYSYEVRKRFLEFMLASFQRSPNFISLLKKPIIDRLGEAYDSQEKTELALQLCWAIGEHGGGGESHKEAARELFESLELLLYENLSSSSRLGLRQESSLSFSRSSSLSISSTGSERAAQSRLLCFVVTAIAKLATYHRELLPRARVSLAKVARSRLSDSRVWTRARDCLGLLNEPAICMSVLGSSRHPKGEKYPGIVNWSDGGTKMIAHVPFYILAGHAGPPFHDFAFSDILPSK
ncbi:unnamed protein product [Amaranthus hypochondriacus]